MVFGEGTWTRKAGRLLGGVLEMTSSVGLEHAAVLMSVR